MIYNFGSAPRAVGGCPSGWSPPIDRQHRMSLEPQPMLNKSAVILLRAKALAFIEKACLNQIRTKGLDNVEPNPGRISVEKVRLAAPDKLVTRVIRNINQTC